MCDVCGIQNALFRVLVVCLIWYTGQVVTIEKNAKPPIMAVATWPFTKATDAAWDVLIASASVSTRLHYGTALSAVVAGCSSAEEDVTIHSVGYGNSPDEQGHTTLDAMVMDGKTMDVGAVAGMPNISQAAEAARMVLLSTKHTLLVGPAAAQFAQSRGLEPRSLDTEQSRKQWREWREGGCQPNYRIPSAWTPNPGSACGPYAPLLARPGIELPTRSRPDGGVDYQSHDTIGLIAIDHEASMAVGVSTSGVIHKIPGRVGDTPIAGAGGYVENGVGAAVGTGDGDVMMRFLLTFKAVDLMRQGIAPTAACVKSLQTVKEKNPWSGALVAVTNEGGHGAACVGFGEFTYSVRMFALGNSSKLFTIKCM